MDVQKQQMTALFTGKWVADADPIMLKKGDFSDIQNYRYTDKGIRGVSGYSKISDIVFILRDSGFGTSAIYCAAYGGGLWIIAGEDRKLATSPNGIDWTLRDITSVFGAGDTVFALCYGSGAWVVAGSGGKIGTSTDGYTWSPSTPASPVPTTFSDGIYDGTLFILTGTINASIQTSPDGIVWASRGTSTLSSYATGVAYDGSGLRCAVGDSSKIISSTDGITWVPAGIGSAVFRIAHNQKDLWVVTSTWGTTVLESSDGVTWVEVEFGETPLTVMDVAYCGGVWFIVGYEGLVKTSSDGLGWTTLDVGFASSFVYTVANNQIGLWVMAGGEGKVATAYMPWSN